MKKIPTEKTLATEKDGGIELKKKNNNRQVICLAAAFSVFLLILAFTFFILWAECKKWI